MHHGERISSLNLHLPPQAYVAFTKKFCIYLYTSTHIDATNCLDTVTCPIIVVGHPHYDICQSGSHQRTARVVVGAANGNNRTRDYVSEAAFR